jgi:hypothetical protein
VFEEDLSEVGETFGDLDLLDLEFCESVSCGALDSLTETDKSDGSCFPIHD